MIVNHQYRFIFLKTRKTAGSSIEFALSKFCSLDDVITTLLPVEEDLRKNKGYRAAQNFLVPFRRYTSYDWLRFLLRWRRKHLSAHTLAVNARRYLGKRIWNGYFKFAFERNPYDKAISRYYFSTQERKRPPVEQYMETADANILSNWPIYTIEDQVVVDFMGRYEDLKNDLETIRRKIGLPIPLDLIRLKGETRRDKRHYSIVLSPKAHARIAKVCAKEIEYFSYKWENF